MSKRWHRALAFVLVTFGASAPVAEAERIGSCADPEYRLRAKGRNVDDIRPLRPLRQRAPVFDIAAVKRVNHFIDFGEVVYGVRLSRGSRDWIQVQRGSDVKPLGWMQADELLCATRPLRSRSTGHARKLFVGHGGPRSVSYPTPDENRCFDRCTDVDGPQVFFIMSEDTESRRFLLSSSSRLGVSGSLVGWIDSEAGVEWQTPFGLRPAPDRREVAGYASVGDVERVAIGETVDPRARLTGGADWLERPLHLPLLESLESRSGIQVYRMFAPGNPAPDAAAATRSFSRSWSEPEPWLEVFAPASDAWIEEVWLTGEEISRWINILRPVVRGGGAGDGEADRLAEILVDRFSMDLGPPAIEVGGETVGAFLRRQNGLPIHSDSPLARYQIAQLREMSACQIRRLKDWLDSSLQLLQVVVQAPESIGLEVKIVYDDEPFCATIAGDGTTIPRRFVESVGQSSAGVASRPGGPYSFLNSHGGELRYWIPRDFLP